MTEKFEKTYYALHPDGTLRTRSTFIDVSFGKKLMEIKTGTGSVPDYVDSIRIDFVRGLYVCTDPLVAEYLDVYTNGGMFQGKYIEGKNQIFIVTSEDPTQKVATRDVVTEKIVEVVKYPISFIESQNVKSLEQLCIASGLSLD